MSKGTSKKKKTCVKVVNQNGLPVEVYQSASTIFGALYVAHENDYSRPSNDELMKLSLLHAQTLYKLYRGEKE